MHPYMGKGTKDTIKNCFMLTKPLPYSPDCNIFGAIKMNLGRPHFLNNTAKVTMHDYNFVQSQQSKGVEMRNNVNQ